jgi:hypothetical protein
LHQQSASQDGTHYQALPPCFGLGRQVGLSRYYRERGVHFRF